MSRRSYSLFVCLFVCLFVSLIAGVFGCEMHFLRPRGNIEDLLCQQRRNKEKAEKTAKSLMTSQVKSRQTQAKKASRKQSKRGKGRGQHQSGSEDAEMEDALAPDADEKAEAAATKILRDAELSQEKTDQVLQEHLERFKIPDTIPLTKLSSPEEKMVRSTRGLLIAQGIAEAEAALALHRDKKKAAEAARAQAHADAPQGPVKVGIGAAIDVLAEHNLVGSKGKAKASKEDREAVTKELMKMGKHLLK